MNSINMRRAGQGCCARRRQSPRVTVARDHVRQQCPRAGSSECLRLLAQWRELFDTVDVVLCPVAPVPAFKHDHEPDLWKRKILIDGRNIDYLDLGLWATIASMTGLPATVAPVGFSSDGLPIGVQIIGPYLGDKTTIAFADFMEREYGGFIPPTLAG